jgi:lactaldehyde dehydrogenase/glycolaldehyde dehydrogenase
MQTQHHHSRGHYIDGEWHDPTGTEDINVHNPATEDVIAELTSATDSEVETAVEAANTAQVDWGRRPATERGELVREVADLLLEYKNELAGLIVKEQGKPRSVAEGEIEAAADLAEYNAEWDRRIEGDILPGDTRDESIHLQRQPVGVVAGIIPWNYPIAVFIRKFAPALVAGNALVAKPSEETPVATMRLAELIDDNVDIPDGVFNLVFGAGETGAHLVQSRGVDMVSMTGNVKTGKQIMRDAADNLTQVSLELGGKAPALVWKDADIDAAVEDVLTARITNTGQVCTCAERVYVHSDVRDEFENKYVEAAQDVTIGDPTEDPDMGPQVNERELEKTERAVARAREQGAEVLLGGSPPSDETYQSGYWYEPTVVSGVEQDMDIMQQEVFGPVTPIMEVETLDEAIEYANDSRYGLSAYLFTNDYKVAMRASEELEFGETYINRTLGESWHGHHIGWNESGLGGEDGKYGFLKYTQLKTVYHNYA